MNTVQTLLSRLGAIAYGVSSRRRIIVVVFLASSCGLGWYGRPHQHRIWRPEETPIAFWTWRSQTPSEDDVRKAVSQTAARTLFLRAGQIDCERGKLRRIRAVSGSFPKEIDVHLVYNATRSCLAVFEKLDTSELAAVVATAYAEDSQRALRDGAYVAGVQLDIDVPTRLLLRYTRILRATRDLLPADLKLSITGLPTWMESSGLNETLAAVDFWIPQCYGATIPERLDRVQPISSATLVASAVARARRMNRPFYAGLAAYGYAIQYTGDGSLIALRGDLDPALVANNADFELINRARFEQTGAPAASEQRYVYRARADSVVAGTAVRKGDSFMLDLPTAGSLQAAARAAREQGGDRLLGLCLFRLPQQSDANTLSIEEVASALAEKEPVSSFRVEMNSDQQVEDESQLAYRRVTLDILNDGAARSRMDDGAMGLLLIVPPGSVRAISFRGFASSDFQCEAPATHNLGDQTTILQPSSIRRAGVLSFRARVWPPGARASATIEFSNEPPDMIRAIFGVTIDDGRVLKESRTLDLKNAKRL